MAYTTLGVFILWFGWFGFNAGSTLSVDYGGVGSFAYVALNTNLATASGVLGAMITAWLVIRKPDLSMMLNGAIGALVAITAACAFVAPWAAIVIGFVAGAIVVLGVLLVERLGVDDPVGALAAHGMSGVWGTLALGFLTVPELAEALDWGGAGLLYGGGLHQLGIQALGLVAVGAFTFTASFLVLLLFKVTVGIRTEPEVEEAGLDVSEHGMWGYPEFYIPVPGGYGTDAHAHIGVSTAPATASSAEPVASAPPAAPAPPSAVEGT
jgi:Amt family ammonium transporter